MLCKNRMKDINKTELGLPSGKESACQCRKHGFYPWSREISHAVEQLSPCSITTESVLQSLCSRARELQLMSPRATATEAWAPQTPC